MGIRAVLMVCGWAAMGMVVAQPGLCAPRPPQDAQTSNWQNSESNHPQPQSSEPGNTGEGGPGREEVDPKVKAAGGSADPEPASTSLGLRELGRNILQDQKQIWTSPMQIGRAHV